jgi:hypothetical protein
LVKISIALNAGTIYGVRPFMSTFALHVSLGFLEGQCGLIKSSPFFCRIYIRQRKNKAYTICICVSFQKLSKLDYHMFTKLPLSSATRVSCSISEIDRETKTPLYLSLRQFNELPACLFVFGPPYLVQSGRDGLVVDDRVGCASSLTVLQYL